MSEFCLDSSSVPKKSHDLSRIVLYDFYLFCSFIFSNPLYFSYFVFFSPHLYKLFSFLSPLFVTTSLLLLALLTVSPDLLHDKLWESETNGDEFQSFEFEELEVYKIVFQGSAFEAREDPNVVLEVKAKEACDQAFEEEPIDKCVIEVGSDWKIVSEAQTGNSVTNNNLDTISNEALWHEIDWKIACEVLTGNSETKNNSDTISDEALWPEIDGKIVSEIPTSNSETKSSSGTISDEALWPEIDGQIVSEVPTGNSEIKNSSGTSSDEALWPEIDRKIEEKEGKVQNLSWEREETKEQEVKPPSSESNKVAEQPLKRSGSKANHNDHNDDLASFQSPRAKFESIDRVQDQYKNHPSFDPTLGSFGSMRKEKEWKRTLACKLFEERHNSSGAGAEGGMDMLWETYEAESSTKKGTKGVAESYGDDDDDEEEEDDNVAGQLCCLQALKFSSGKMNLGMRRPSLVKFSKALKGMGWLHHVGKASRKVHR